VGGHAMSELVARYGRPRLTAIACRGVGPGGERCGRTYTGRGSWSLLDQARAAGWRIGALVDGTPDAMCERCSRPDPELVRLCRELGQR
jgi:hypothetical protein